MAVEKSGLYYPNKMSRIYLMAMEEVMGANGIKAVLNLAKVPELIDNYPPNNLAREFDFADFGTIGNAIEEMYGPRGGRGLALRAGANANLYVTTSEPDKKGDEKIIVLHVLYYTWQLIPKTVDDVLERFPEMSRADAAQDMIKQQNNGLDAISILVAAGSDPTLPIVDPVLSLANNLLPPVWPPRWALPNLRVSQHLFLGCVPRLELLSLRHLGRRHQRTGAYLALG